jgi:hypothetical protein
MADMLPLEDLVQVDKAIVEALDVFRQIMAVAVAVAPAVQG